MSALRATYKAYLQDRLGPIDDVLELRDVSMEPLPVSHVRIQVRSAALNPLDVKVAEIYGSKLVGKPDPTPEQPYRVGWDVAGVVVEVGSDVKTFQVGDEVYSSGDTSDFGSLAEYLTVSATVVALKPKTLDFDHAAGVPVASITGYQAIMKFAQLHPGQRILILGGSCATGMFAVQLAKTFGAYVIATTSSKNAALVTSLGADEVIDYRTQKWRDELEAHSVDVVFDCGMEPASWDDDAQTVLKKTTGRFLTLVGGPHSDAKFGATYCSVVAEPSGRDLEEIAQVYDSGKAKVVIDAVFPLEQAKQAFARLKTGHTAGKVIVKVL